MTLFESKVEIPAASADALNDLLLERGESAWSVVEDVIAHKAWLVGIFPNAAEARQQYAALSGAAADLPKHAEVRELPEKEWRDSYKAHFHAWKFGRLHWVPIWEKETFNLPRGEKVLWLDPGLAFGTGNHETTRLCIERLMNSEDKLAAAGKRRAEVRVIDAGCGSGILALSAALLGFTRVSAFDNDPQAVEVSGENAEMNGLDGKVEFYVGDLISGLAGRTADVVLANIQADVLMRFKEALLGAVAAGGTLILSGILASERDQVREVFAAAAPGWTVESRILGEWSDVVLTKALAPPRAHR